MILLLILQLSDLLMDGPRGNLLLEETTAVCPGGLDPLLAGTLVGWWAGVSTEAVVAALTGRPASVPSVPTYSPPRGGTLEQGMWVPGGLKR